MNKSIYSITITAPGYIDIIKLADNSHMGFFHETDIDRYSPSYLVYKYIDRFEYFESYTLREITNGILEHNEDVITEALAS